MAAKQNFDQWKKAIDDYLEDKLGFPSSIFPNIDYSAMHDAGRTPAETAEFVITNSKNH